MTLFTQLGRYALMLAKLWSRPEKFSIYWKEFIRQCDEIGINSLGIVLIVSVFLGAVTTVQTAFQLVSPVIPKSTIGSIVTNSTILELAPTVLSLILAGKIGSSIAGELGTMRITEQIDALEIMGINSAAYLITPKLIACVIMIPVLASISGFVTISAGVFTGQFAGLVTQSEFMQASVEYFTPFTITFSLIKCFTFGFIISTVSAYYGYYTEGGSLEVGRNSTRAVVACCIAILFSDYILAQTLL